MWRKQNSVPPCAPATERFTKFQSVTPVQLHLRQCGGIDVSEGINGRQLITQRYQQTNLASQICIIGEDGQEGTNLV